MSVPPVKYVTTPDGYDIAYTVTGNGYPVVFLPSFINHVQEVWTEGFSVATLLHDLSAGHQVVNYDSRGMGMSTRGLADDLTLESFIVDLDTVLGQLKLHKFVLIGSFTLSFLAMRYAVQNPGRVSALVLINPPHRWHPAVWSQLPEQNWEAFLLSRVSHVYGMASREVLETFKRWSTQKDYLASVRVWEAARLEHSLHDLQTPTLILWSGKLQSTEESAIDLARLLPHSQLVSLDSALPYGAQGEAAGVIDRFLESASLGSAGHDRTRFPDGLSERQVEVLRLIAAGKSNAQIAEELVISQNTVIRHISNIFAKTSASNRTEATTYAHRHGLVQ